MTRGKPMTGHCKGCGVSELQVRQLCTRCYDYARTHAHRQQLDLDTYLAITDDLASPGRHHERPYQHNRSGYRGCYLDHGKWRACIRHQGKSIHLGRFDTPEAAQTAYRTAQARLRDGLPPKFNVYLPPALIRRAKYCALDEQLSLSDLVERALERYLDQEDVNGSAR